MGIGRISVAVLAAVLIIASTVQLWRTSNGVRTERVILADSPATVYRPTAAQEAPLAIVAHGFGGSRQMMEALSRTLARSGFAVVAFDFIGHGRHGGLLSPEVGRIEGTTAQLVAQTVAVARAARDLPGMAPGPVTYLGHSMATDIAIRAAQDLGDAASIVAISMYSEAVTADFPERLLVVSGEWEARLRTVGLRVLHQIDPTAPEGETVQAGAVFRRTIAAPYTEHVGVLYSPVTLREARDWALAAMPGAGPSGVIAATGPWVAGLLFGIVLAGWPLAGLVPLRAREPCRMPARAFALALAVPVLPAAGAMAALAGAGSVAGFVPIAAFLGAWGGAQLIVLIWAGWRPGGIDPRGVAMLLIWGLVFALVMDRVGGAFVPTGPRAGLLAVLLVGAVPFAVADAALAYGAPVWRRVVARVLVLIVLGAVMVLVPARLGVTFTVLPVMVLFWLVYGSFARWIAARAGPVTAATGTAVWLAWSIAATTPLFAVP